MNIEYFLEFTIISGAGICSLSLNAYSDVNYFFNEVITESTRDSIIRYKLYMEGNDDNSNGIRVKTFLL